MARQERRKSDSKHREKGPKVVVCQECCAKDKLQPIISKLGYRDIVSLSSAQEFARWFFGGRRDGEFILVTGWREAKPCAAAILAARTGHVERLRPDAKRPQLAVCEGSDVGMDAVAGSTANGAIGRMVVVIPSGQGQEMLNRQRKKAAKWAASEDVRGLLFEVIVKTGTADLALALEAGMQDTGTEAGMQDTGTEVCAEPAMADHNAYAMPKPVAFLPDRRGSGASGAGHRLRTPSPIYLYRPQSSGSRSTESLALPPKSLALPPDGSLHHAPRTGSRLRTPSPIYRYKPQSPSSPYTPSTTCFQRASEPVAIPPEDSSYHAFIEKHRLPTPSQLCFYKPPQSLSTGISERRNGLASQFHKVAPR